MASPIAVPSPAMRATMLSTRLWAARVSSVMGESTKAWLPNTTMPMRSPSRALMKRPSTPLITAMRVTCRPLTVKSSASMEREVSTASIRS